MPVLSFDLSVWWNPYWPVRNPLAKPSVALDRIGLLTDGSFTSLHFLVLLKQQQRPSGPCLVLPNRGKTRTRSPYM